MLKKIEEKNEWWKKQFNILSKLKELSLCHKLEFSDPFICLQPDGVNIWFDLTEFIGSNII